MSIYTKNLFVEIYTLNGASYYLPVQVQIYQPTSVEAAVINQAPYIFALSNTIVAEVNPETPVLEFSFELSEPVDLEGELALMTISSTTLGTLEYTYSAVQTPELQTQSSNLMTYYISTNMLTIQFPTFEDLLIGAHAITITLTDEQGLTNNINLSL